ncbi:MAG: hypothetical protein HY900_27000 [Deltaproteobacteria bacterium]|nr:hypothetical protein [Deltaproteobacteria bacterium]
MAFAQEIFLSLVALLLFFVSLANPRPGTARRTALVLSAASVVMAVWCFGATGELFGGTYRVDLYSQSFKF